MTDIKFESSTMERFILSYLIKNKSFFLKVGQYLKTNDFNKKSYFLDIKLQWVLNTCSVYYEQYERVPSLDTIKLLIERKFKDDALLSKAMTNTVEEIYNKDLSSMEGNFIEDETVKFIRTARAVEATLLNQLDIANGKFDQINDRMQKALNVNLDKDFGISLSDIGNTLSLIQEVEEE